MKSNKHYYQYTRPNGKSASSKHTLSGPQKTDSGLLMHYQPYSSFQQSFSANSRNRNSICSPNHRSSGNSSRNCSRNHSRNLALRSGRK